MGLEALERLRLDSLKETALLGEDSSGSRQIHAEGESKCRRFAVIFHKKQPAAIEEGRGQDKSLLFKNATRRCQHRTVMIGGGGGCWPVRVGM